jgi:hypothetical protein
MDLSEDALHMAPPAFQSLSLSGPKMLSLRNFRSVEEQNRSIQDAVFSGRTQAAQPQLWQSYLEATDEVRAKMKSIEDLRARFPQEKARIDAAVSASGRRPDSLAWMGLISKSQAWTVLLDTATLQPVSIIEIDSSEQ